MGMDEHGVKVQQSAEAANITPQEWVDDIAAQFIAMWRRLHISHDDFMRTTQQRHTRAATELVRRIQASGDVFPGSYEGYYCVGCESFKRDEELVRDDDGKVRCPLHPNRALEWTEERNWFFRLSAYRDRLLRFYEENPGFIQPEARRNEMLRLVQGGLEDLSFSRAAVSWGIAWPGDEEHTIYVWIEALMNYVSATGFPEPGYERLWPADVHVIGKDISRFHCVIWPAMLMAAGLELPRSVWSHGFVNFSGRKLSKSEGVKVELSDAIERCGADALRYYLLRDVAWDGDGDFTWERFDVRYEADLADNVGNLVSRTLAMLQRYRGAVVPRGTPTRLDAEMHLIVQRYRQAMDANLLHHGAAQALELASQANGFIEERAPWSQAKQPDQASALDDTLASLIRALAALAVLLTPFIPARARYLADRLGLPEVLLLDDLDRLDLAGRSIARGDVLFPKEPDPPA
jgi:methionyl-tRNA synthetase